MTTEMKKYQEEFESIYNGSPWYGKPLVEVIAMADPATVFSKPHPGGHSAWEIAQHLLAWREVLVKRLNGDTNAGIEADSEADWNSLPGKSPETAWEVLAADLGKNQAALLKGLEGWSDEALDKDFVRTGYTLRTHLNGQIQHDVYHIGQIALVIKNN